VPAIWVEREQGVFACGASRWKGARVVIVEDIVTTGLSIRETIECLRDLGAEVLPRPASSTACRQDRCRRATDRARRVRGSGLSG
jgi:orotate phosphoribosyltransferase